jgi:hypothetical protein
MTKKAMIKKIGKWTNSTAKAKKLDQSGRSA